MIAVNKQLKSFQLVLLLLLGACLVFSDEECKLQAKNEKIRKKAEVFTRLVNKLLCSSQAEAKTTTVTAPTVTAQPALLSAVAVANSKKDEMCGREFVAVPGNKKTVHCCISASSLNSIIEVKQIDFNLCTHAVLTGFAIRSGEDFEVTLHEKYLPDLESILSACKEKKTTAILEIGAFEQYHPEKFSKMANDQDSKDTFISSVMEIFKKYSGLGGLFINWRYPVFWHNNYQKPCKQDFVNYPKLMNQLSEKLKEEKLVLCSSGSSSGALHMMYDFPKLVDIIDFWLLDSYHFEGPWSIATAISSSTARVDEMVKMYGKYNLYYDKLVVSIPADNVPVSLADEKKTKLNSQLKKGPLIEIFKNLKSICNELTLGGVTVVHNESNRVNSYAVKNKIWVSFETSMMIKKKVQMVIDKNMSGISLKYLHDDDFEGQCKCGKFHLLRSINEGLRGDGSCVPQLCP